MKGFTAAADAIIYIIYHQICSLTQPWCSEVCFRSNKCSGAYRKQTSTQNVLFGRISGKIFSSPHQRGQPSVSMRRLPSHQALELEQASGRSRYRGCFCF